MFYLTLLCAALGIIIAALTIKTVLMKKSAREIRQSFSERLTHNTNTLITISSRDTDMRALANDINIQLRQLGQKRHLYEQGDFELKEAVTNISHDLRTPLTAICGYLDMLEQIIANSGGDMDEAKRYLAIIRERTEALKQLTEELFEYSVFTTAAYNADNSVFENVCLNGAIEESVAAYYAALNGAGITPDIIFPDNQVYRRLNKNALSRILGNIISNAIKYSDGGLKIQLFEDGRMTFTNRASSLDETQAGRLFDRFFTVNAAAKSSGLGLAIAKALTEQMHGEISARYSDGSLEILLRFPDA